MTDDVKDFIENEKLVLRDFISQVDRQFDEVRKELMGIHEYSTEKAIALVKTISSMEGQIFAYNKIMFMLDNKIKEDLRKSNEIKVIPFVRRNKDD